MSIKVGHFLWLGVSGVRNYGDYTFIQVFFTQINLPSNIRKDILDYRLYINKYIWKNIDLSKVKKKRNFRWWIPLMNVLRRLRRHYS